MERNTNNPLRQQEMKKDQTKKILPATRTILKSCFSNNKQGSTGYRRGLRDEILTECTGTEIPITGISQKKSHPRDVPLELRGTGMHITQL